VPCPYTSTRHITPVAQLAAVRLADPKQQHLRIMRLPPVRLQGFIRPGLDQLT